ncbi:hypothetical protein BB562_14010 [Lactiplantibacillus pentosus]|uniref:hypothetical protein n=1 Tax=Lactiplantibacillus pentosus TaxID=1589 RepID=UPI000CA2008D|nr:hypothetical protein [Lactiplantibacillus pentosus]AUI79715.1 hypothetical protein BB562_14010 [Lactiplantibacillus pentosus]
MSDEMKVNCYFVPNLDFTAELRVFKERESYPIYENDDYFLLMAENGEFALTPKALTKTIHDWSSLGRFETAGDGDDD